MTNPRIQGKPVATAEELAAAIGATDFSNCSATVIGYGNMGKEYVRALRALGVGGIRVCSRSPGALEELNGLTGVEAVSGGFDLLESHPGPGELGIVATPVESLVPASVKLAYLGFRKLLIEKPVSLWSREIEFLDEKLNGLQVEGMCAFNRTAYPSFQEIKSRCRQEGGITSCTYTLTEMIRDDWTERFSAQELSRWGIANSMHVMSLAHGLIGSPATWSAHRSGKIDWHPSGAVFVGSGISDAGTPFSYHADWGSTGRWSVEVHTAASSYRLCPLEQVLRRTSSASDWEEVPVAAFAPQIKAGFAEQVAAMLDDDIRRRLPLVSLSETAALTRFAEDVFGYDSDSHSKLKKEPETSEAVS
jgi:predicted dehydrogenase